MKIGISTWSFSGLNNQNAFDLIDHAKKYQYDCLDLTLDDYVKYFDWINADEASIIAHFKELKAYADEHGIRFSQTHAPYGVFPKFLDEAFLEIQKKSIIISSIVGAPFVVMHPLVFPVYNRKTLEIEERDYNIKFLTQLIPYLEKWQVKIALENIYDWEKGSIRMIYVSNPEGLLSYLELLPQEYFVICLDTGHLNMAGFTPKEAIELWGNRLQVLHVNDNFGILDDHLAPFMGAINWQEFKDALKSIGFSGCMSLEIKPFKYLNICESGFKFARELAEQLGM